MAIFSIAMAYLEAAVVVYLRMIFYPEGFQFPLKLMPTSTLLIELGREVSTIVMLVIVGFMAGKALLEKFFYFMFCFGMWDIFYYVWLKVMLDWPASLLTGDILFLIPVPWIGPVLAPVVVSLSMIITSIWCIHLQDHGFELKLHKPIVLLAFLGVFVVFISFIWSSITYSCQQPPNRFLWEVFISGKLLGVGSLLLIRRNKNKNMG